MTSTNREAEQHVNVGTELGYYRLVKKLGEGGMGSVWQALHTKLDKQVAVKVLPATWSRDPALLTRFEREMKAVGKLEHPHIVRAMDAGEFNGTHYLVMEFNEGLDLSAYIKQRGPQSVTNACEMLRHAAVGLAHAHEAGLIHRDIKPSNLFLTKTGKVKILDLGLARVQGDTSGGGQTLTGFGQVLGTPDYMAPEQWENTHSVDGRSDLYALGCTLFYLLTGRAPFSDGKHSSLVGKMKGHTLDPIPDLQAARIEAIANRPKLIFDLISEELNALYRKLMAKRPEERFASASELAEALTVFGKSQSGASGVLAKGSSPVAPRQESRTSLDATSTTDSQPKTSVPHAPGDPVAERQGYGVTAPFIMTEFEPKPPTNSLDANDVPTILTMFAEASSSTQHDASASGQETLQLDHSLARRAGPSGLKLGLILGGLATLILAGVIVFKITGKRGTEVDVAAKDDSVKVETTSEDDVKPAPKKKRDRQSATKSDTTPSVASAEPTATSPAVPNPPPTTPEPAPTPPVVTNPKPTTPEPTTAPTVTGRTLIVGVAPGEIGNIGAALAQATPGDTILIRHRGPLEFPPVDLTGKTPLTIAGDVKDDVDYWPILRQAVLPEGAAVPPAAKGLFFGKNLQLTFRKVHLGIGGHQRQPIESAFHLDAGKLEFADCTVTVAANGVGIDSVGSLIPFVQCAGTAAEPLELNFQRTLVRGGRLNGCLNAVQPGSIRIVADQFLWAGGAAPWLTLQECGQPCRVQLDHSTLYNVGGLAVAALTEGPRETDSAALSFQVDHCLLTGPRVASPPLLQVTAPEVTSLAKAVEKKWLDWKGTGVVWHQINGDAATTNKGTSPAKAWCQLFGLEERSLVVADPMFRVRPSGVELQEATGRDFEPRFGRATKKPPRDADLAVGASSSELPVALACINSRNLATEALASVPRGPARVLRVHQADGPFRKLEDAISKAQSDDIIEIADNAVYVPTRNFSTASANGVLNNDSIECLAIRAVDDSQAVIAFRDDVQQGVLPGSARDNGTALYLLSTRSRSLSIDGLHFRTVMAKPTLHSLIFQTGPGLRVTNCTCVDTTTAPSAPGNRFVYQTTHAGKGGTTWYAQGEWLGWFENSAFLYAASPPSLQNDPRQSEVAVHCGHYAPDPLSKVARNNVFRNCLFGSNLIGVESLVLHLELAPLTEVLTFEQCTLLGRMANLTGGRTREKLICTDNLVVAPDNPVMATSPELFSATQVEGSGNAYWQTAGAIRSQDRDQGSLSLVPGPLLKSMPAFGGNATAADTLKPFRLKPGSPLDKMATDGGSVGVRFEYLPAPPPFRPEMIKRVK